MFDDTELYKRLTLTLFAALTLATGCGSDSPGTPGADGGIIDAAPPPPPPIDAPPPPPPPPTVFSKRASRSSTIAISEDDSHVAMVNPDDNIVDPLTCNSPTKVCGSVSVFQTSDNTRISKITVGGRPSSVVIAGDGKTAYVANRDDGTISRIVDIDGASAKANATTDVGSEPVGLALSPSGLKLYVAEFAESRVSIIDTQTMMVTSSVKVDRPRAVLVTNNADTSDDDEHLLVSQYFGVPVAGKEVKDDGRTGQIVNFALTSVTDGSGSNITLAPIASGFGPLFTSPNQLNAMAVVGTRLYITSVSASPQPPATFNGNVFPVMYVADLSTNTEVRDASGTANLAKKVVDLIPTPTAASPRFIPGDLSDIAFLDASSIGYAVGKAGDVMLRLQYGADLKIGAAQNAEIDLIGNPNTIGQCLAPTGVVVSKTLGRGYVNCWASRKLGLVDFSVQQLTQTVDASQAPADPSPAKGRRFFFTGRARWSNGGTNGAKGGEGWSSCGSCHPDGLTDNITWQFASGPRQTTSMDGTFTHGPGVGPQKQRILNWTAINDELHDFEANVRNVQTGLGAITQNLTTPGECLTLDEETGVVFNAPLKKSNKELADASAGSCKRADWDDITNWVKTISPSHASRLRDTDAITHGRALFSEGGCDKCHGGAGWTLSRRPYSPASVGPDGGAEIIALQDFTQTVFNGKFVYGGRKQISNEPAVAVDPTGPASPGAPILQLACALRNVSTFGVAGDVTLEVRPPIAGVETGFQPAQGRAGYNIPSLYSLALGAPFLHHGQSRSLDDLFSNAKWADHATAGNANFGLTLADAKNRGDLIKFLLSIDPATTEFNIPTLGALSFDICPGTPGQSL
jgi:YVTN family beta-propeller protein